MKTIRIDQIKINACEVGDCALQNAIRDILNTDNSFEYKILKKSIDARKKPEIYYVYSVAVSLKDFNLKKLKSKKNITTDYKEVTYNRIFDTSHIPSDAKRPVIVGFGPAGIFCAYLLSLNGLKPIVFERGSSIEKRTTQVEAFWNNGILNELSNVQFGEGGAGTFSDGKLNTGISDKNGRIKFVLETFVKFGADESILYDSKPHIGTDVLHSVIKNIRNEIIKLGGEIYFDSPVTDFKFKNNRITSITVNNTQTVECDSLILAIGHSARDTYKKLHDYGISMEKKPFAMGLRIQHNQADIDNSMYGLNHPELPVSPYKLTGHTKNNRNVYSFCMCPGGYVVNASSEKEALCVNGMSYHDRASGVANAALVTTIFPEDIENDKDFKDDKDDVLKGIRYQRHLEKAAFNLAKGKIPIQTYADFVNNQKSTRLGSVTPKIKGSYELSNIRELLPEYISEAIIECMGDFSKKIKGYDNPDAVLCATETRTSSPVRIVRNDNFMSENIYGVFPCGEGAGYAGGITSAATDGIKTFEAVIKQYQK